MHPNDNDRWDIFADTLGAAALVVLLLTALALPGLI